jgi:uncharacterized protein (DUF1697 family)
MTTYIALLRAVNVGGRNLVPMASLRECAAALGLGHPKTLLQSGNLVFDASASKTASLERVLEAEIAGRLGLQNDVVVRAAAEWDRLIAQNPFPAEAASDPAHLVVMVLKGSAAPADVARLQASIRGREVVKGEGRHLYFVYPDGIGDSKLTASVIEKAVGTRGTARNWNTILKLRAMAGAR